jgi:nitroreductase
MIKDLVLQSRSCRRFDQTHQVNEETLRALVDLARLSPTGANMQPLKFFIAFSNEMNAKIFPTLSWAGYLKDWSGPIEGERPTAYIIILGDKTIKENFGVDPGIAAQSMLLGAVEMGLGGCMIASVKREALKEALHIADHFETLLVLALGKPLETVVIEEVPQSGDIRYYRDKLGIHHVPKRSLEDLIIN